MLTEAKRYLQKVMDVLGAEIDAGLPIVVLEPSCASVFRDELPNLFPHDARASRLRHQVFLLSEFLVKHAPRYAPPKLSAKILLHGHCHHKALMKMNDEESLLRRMGVELECPDAGCCGMAGPFGFERGKFAIAQAIGERVLLPAVRSATPETIVVADGFSCREQIRQSTGRTAMHLADVLRSAGRPERPLR
jgi:Fe-S oxidoreductase